MQNETRGRASFSVLYLFLGLSALILLFKNLVPGSGIDYRVLMIGNLLLFLVGWISIKMGSRALHHQSVQVFLRLVYGSFLLKLFILAAAAIAYIAIYKKGINKPALFGCFGLYFLYMIVEVRTVMKQSKKPNV